MKRSVLICTALALTMAVQAQWIPVGNKIKTDWAEKVNPQNVLPEYPRPQMERAEWQSLNGLWEYAIQTKGKIEPASFDGEILVPFAIESSLSGVQKEVGENNELWYKREFSVPSAWKNKNILLHFGAVDWMADIFVNDILIGSHQGGYTPFSFDITPYLSAKTKHKLVVRVWDPSDKGYQPRGKQVANPSGIWYTPVTGIWQTVWLEPVAADHITSIKAIPDIDTNTLSVTVGASSCDPSQLVEVQLIEKGKLLASARGLAGKELRLGVDNPTLWDTENPYLYDMKVSLVKNGKVMDRVNSYTAFRKISIKQDANGIMRMQLNNKNLFHYGPLDQGWWPDGLYTAPTDEALLFDILKTKEWGFNMIRKHVKVEPARWYYHCDRLGMLVWQDMPSGDMGNQWQAHVYNGGTDKKRSAASIANFYQEWKEIMDLCISNPSVVIWVPFNEAWGQFDTEKVTEWTAAYDPSRLVNPASGGNHRACGDILDLHNYPGPRMFLSDPMRVNVLGEYGGIGLPLEGHLWQPDRNWGYIQFKNSREVTAEYVKYARELKEMIQRGFSAAVYTQTTDVEVEVNGLMTYDRKVMKIDEAAVKRINQEVIQALSE
ncbi:beta-galactosidase/beta-glucuronidase [Parabacteroides sp. PFB2-12]|uniref:glycoside hydrolase family 2 protein n=1 Tax=unclassified Parabacteroides TaxID=2649774 RepID=UPI002475BBD1|nr:MULTISPECIES: sugar-binding domain-containing protein [unclassified Parabacteroides]MDH6342086.1 beta-galactosidase/beta-glucuronidase [Parabacteroides sp. PM6-13]MDH6389505.1 beta-galactosidase/beta-glucuronidase [Parabacteroides sp. PFB2-12]